MKYLKYIILSISASAVLYMSGCATVNPISQPTIDEAYQTTWTAAEAKTAEAYEEFSLTIGKDQLIFISDDLASEVTTYVTMDYTVVEVKDQVYHLTLSNPVGRVVDIKEQAGETLDANAIANTLWQQYQDMYINIAETSSISMYAAGHETSPIILFQK